ncbi:hypothetical protein VTG60DRAFT_3854 [Thermothelomyces hinnuleus]
MQTQHQLQLDSFLITCNGVTRRFKNAIFQRIFPSPHHLFTIVPEDQNHEPPTRAQLGFELSNRGTHRTSNCFCPSQHANGVHLPSPGFDIRPSALGQQGVTRSVLGLRRIFEAKTTCTNVWLPKSKQPTPPPPCSDIDRGVSRRRLPVHCCRNSSESASQGRRDPLNHWLPNRDQPPVRGKELGHQDNATTAQHVTRPRAPAVHRVRPVRIRTAAKFNIPLHIRSNLTPLGCLGIARHGKAPNHQQAAEAHVCAD